MHEDPFKVDWFTGVLHSQYMHVFGMYCDVHLCCSVTVIRELICLTIVGVMYMYKYVYILC